MFTIYHVKKKKFKFFTNSTSTYLLSSLPFTRNELYYPSPLTKTRLIKYIQPPNTQQLPQQLTHSSPSPRPPPAPPFHHHHNQDPSTRARGTNQRRTRCRSNAARSAVDRRELSGARHSSNAAAPGVNPI